MNFDMQYFFDDYIYPTYLTEILMVNKNQTLLTLNTYNKMIKKSLTLKIDNKAYVFSMETGTLISKYG